MPENEIELRGLCSTCGGEMSDDGCQFCYCAECGSRLCEHHYCIENWCNANYRCPDCADKEWRAIEAEDEARYWSHPGWKEVFGEDQ